jgi:hypothetical protein
MNKEGTGMENIDELWPYQEPDFTEFNSWQRVNVQRLKVGDIIARGKSPAGAGKGNPRMVRVISIHPEIEVIRAETVWDSPEALRTRRISVMAFDSAESTYYRLYIPRPRQAALPTQAAVNRPQAPGTVQKPEPAPGTLAALNCIHAAIVESTRQSQEAAKQLFANQSEQTEQLIKGNEYSEEVAETLGKLMVEMLAEIRGLREDFQRAWGQK